MQRRKVRVVLGSDGAEARDFLSGFVEKQSGVVVGQAQNAPEAISLARNLRPDVVILDCHLPHTFGLKQVRLSRAGGLDAAQFISQEVPNALVLLVGNLDSPIPIGSLTNPELAVSLHLDYLGGTDTPFLLSNLPATKVANPIFTRVYIQKGRTNTRYLKVADEVILFGTLGILIGLMMMVTGILFVPGILMTALGGLADIIGFGVRFLLRHITGTENR
ncbi:MAG: hypothetical protein Q7R57_00400 [Dehalococcoidales bacterium]|nr:hypothetical protein [Dehalococcoidales bacterium]